MKGVMRLLAAAKLVELSPEEAAELQQTPEPTAAGSETDPYAPPAPVIDEAALLAEEAGMAAPAATSVAVLPPLPPGSLPEGRPFDDIYAAAGLPQSPYPAERLLRLIDGLKAMDAATRRTAVHAMDAADDSWTIDDPLLDAERKVRALQDWTAALAASVGETEQAVAAEIADLKATEEKAVAEIRKQIAGLEQLLEREMRKTAETIAARQQAVDADRAALQRESQRVTAEIDRLAELGRQFGTSPHSSQGV